MSLFLYSTRKFQAPGTVGNEKNECQKKRAEIKRLFLPRPVSFLLPKYTLPINTLLNLHNAKAFNLGTY